MTFIFQIPFFSVCFKALLCTITYIIQLCLYLKFPSLLCVSKLNYVPFLTYHTNFCYTCSMKRTLSRYNKCTDSSESASVEYKTEVISYSYKCLIAQCCLVLVINCLLCLHNNCSNFPSLDTSEGRF